MGELHAGRAEGIGGCSGCRPCTRR
jgi:hypothetical protein